MEIIIMQASFTLLNLIFAIWMYEKENYKTAIFNGFSAGACFMGMLNAL